MFCYDNQRQGNLMPETFTKEVESLTKLTSKSRCEQTIRSAISFFKYLLDNSQYFFQTFLVFAKISIGLMLSCNSAFFDDVFLFRSLLFSYEDLDFAVCMFLKTYYHFYVSFVKKT